MSNTYADWADLIARYPGADKRGGSTEVGAGYLDPAARYVDARLGGIYSVPFTDSIPLIGDMVVDVAYARLAVNDKASGRIMSSVHSMFAEIRNGDLILITSSGDTVERTSEIGGVAAITNSGYLPTFTELGPDEDRLDPDLIEDLRSDRDLLL